MTGCSPWGQSTRIAALGPILALSGCDNGRRNESLSGQLPHAEQTLAGLFLTAAAAALYRWLIAGEPEVFHLMVTSLFDMARVSVEVMVLLFGTLTLWLGFLRIAEGAGLVEKLAHLLGRCSRA